MASTKVTFTLDNTAVARLGEAAERLGRPKSEIVREAILEYYDRIGKLSERERLHMLRAFDDLIPKIPARPVAAVRQELNELRRARRAGGRRTAQ